MLIGAFSRKETEVLKGFGILLIVFHNFLHNLTPIVGENQFSYSYSVFQNFYSVSVENPQEIFRTVLSYFGHYGVQIFIFFSAYGLTRKYWTKEIETSDFLIDRIIKIYFSIMICIVVYIVLGLIKSSFFTDEKVLYWDSLLWKVLLISNLIPHEALMPVGPWWFISFIFQFYLVFFLLLRAFKKHDILFLGLLSVTAILLEIFFNSYFIRKGVNLNYQIIGNLPVLCAGMIFAGRSQVDIKTRYLLSMLILFALGNLNKYLWVVSGLFFTLSIIWLSKKIFKSGRLPNLISTPLAFFGGISLQLFLVNGFLRSPFHNFAESYNFWYVDIFAAVASVSFSTIFALVLRKSDQLVRLFARKIMGMKNINFLE